MALTTAFQTWMDQQGKLAQKGQDTGIRKLREKVRQENGNKLIVLLRSICLLSRSCFDTPARTGVCVLKASLR
jgi:hypothetical protein